MQESVFSVDQALTDTSYPVCQLTVCDLRLVDDARWPWLLLIPRVPHAVELIDLVPDLRGQVWIEIDHVSRVLRDLCVPHKLNVAALGNQVRQLHIHVIARFVDDPAWPNPVWGTPNPVPYEANQLAERLRLLRDGLR